MAVPPAYADLGKSAKDIFNKGYGNINKFENSYILTILDHSMPN